MQGLEMNGVVCLVAASFSASEAAFQLQSFFGCCLHLVGVNTHYRSGPK